MVGASAAISKVGTTLFKSAIFTYLVTSLPLSFLSVTFVQTVLSYPLKPFETLLYSSSSIVKFLI
jgi:hypothetical protein